MDNMLPQKPYLLRAYYDWIVDSGFTAFLLIDATAENVEVPRQFVNDKGEIVFDVSPGAVKNLMLDNQVVAFQARFSGALSKIYLPIHSIKAVFAQENGYGINFDDLDETLPAPEDVPLEPIGPSGVVPSTKKSDDDDGGPPLSGGGKGKPPFLKVVK